MAAACLWTTDTASVVCPRISTPFWNVLNSMFKYVQHFSTKLKITLTLTTGSCPTPVGFSWSSWARRGSDQEAQHWRLPGGRCIFEALLHGDRAAARQTWQMHWISLDHSSGSWLFYISDSLIYSYMFYLIFFYFFLFILVLLRFSFQILIILVWLWPFVSFLRKSTPPPVLKKPKFGKSTDLNPTTKVRTWNTSSHRIWKLCSYQKTLKMSFQLPQLS